MTKNGGLRTIKAACFAGPADGTVITVRRTQEEWTSPQGEVYRRKKIYVPEFGYRPLFIWGKIDFDLIDKTVAVQACLDAIDDEDEGNSI